MILEATIEQLRTYCPLLGGRVAGAAQFQLGLQNYNTNMALPAGYVLPLGQSSEGLDVMAGGYYQFVHKALAVVVEFDAKPDRRGQAPAMNFDAMEASLFSALLNWAPGVCFTRNRQGYWFEGARFLDLDRARCFYQWEFALNTILDSDDAWHDPVVPDPLSIELDIYKAPPFEMPPPDGRPPAAIIKINPSEDGP